MESPALQYWQALRALLETTVTSQVPAIERAAELAADALVAGHRLYVYDTGHLLSRELVNRAGGLVALTPFTFHLAVDNTIAHEMPRVGREPDEEEIRGYVRYALGQAGVRAGDAVIIGSVTGARVLPVEVALQLRAAGVRLIGLTSREYSAFVPARHSSGKKLADLCDVVIDNHCLVGDAVLPMAGDSVRVGPTSGISAATLMWMFCAEVVARQRDRGKTPLVLESMNLPGAVERNRKKALQYLSAFEEDGDD
ncbi:MAG: sugar isomerase domain-containing protein [Thermaerobacter sp.]|nr:sugar isomerase domain-containing protein [Thermaerobacter sp.]